MEPTIYKPSIYKGAGIYKIGAEGGGGGGTPDNIELKTELYSIKPLEGATIYFLSDVLNSKNFELEVFCNVYLEESGIFNGRETSLSFLYNRFTGYSGKCGIFGNGSSPYTPYTLFDSPTFRPYVTGMNFPEIPTGAIIVNHYTFVSKDSYSGLSITLDNGNEYTAQNSRPIVDNTTTIESLLDFSTSGTGKNGFISIFKVILKNNDEVINELIPAFDISGAGHYQKGFWCNIQNKFYATYDGGVNTKLDVR